MEDMLLINEETAQVKEISVAIQQMASGSQQLVASINDIKEISPNTASRTQTVSAAIEEQSASMEEIAEVYSLAISQSDIYIIILTSIIIGGK